MADNIKQKTMTNLIWRFGERCGAQIVQFIVSIVLARILAPEAYGTIALVMVFAQILQVFVDSGLGNALIQKKGADDLDFSSVFIFNIIWCLILYLIIFLTAPLIASFYSDEGLVSIIRVLCLTVVISGLKNVQQAYVSRTLQFKKFFFATIGGTIASAIVGIIMALMGLGVWALVAQKLVNLSVDTIVLWFTVKWRPKLIFSFQRLKGLISYGWKLFASAMLDTIYTNLRQLIIGKMYTEADLAFYNQGKQFPNLIVANINTSIDSVLLPVLSLEQDDTKRVKEMTRRSIKISTYIMAPLMMGLAFTATSVVNLVLTDKWLLCVPYLKIFCITFMFYPIHTANLNAIKAMGRSDLFLKLEIAKKIVGMILLFCTMWFGVLAMAYSLLVNSLVSQIINSYPNKKLLNYGYIEQLKDILPSITLAVFMGGVISIFNCIDCSDIIMLLLQVTVGSVIYIVGSIIFKMDSFNYLLEIVRNLIKR
ncbi:lipopolysaccharide biosynthesis protein [Bariatricus massiliensis]|uniref:Lipopolysaccharide biosynthesis protein n=1 Tax=Bariatricus massiliensis TaxID=1745713 RepID=A0ABS8DCW9_9FIRM|nr:lipopolysaccharide biosynthesis protein [Bariatricus massiliensis]MCB7303462.1 lipopolysaccharide biosynthesis protein [Bariatricus massiliensis]MCB7373594.1 lipopolysaccharide biosynthesis protein [Bariatricus massiliensis]MCB7386264.1 lipopolysaccharide biosynthesis protein [Bariatricus massiliensis]MCB7410426.1 lipopolysaccharide biosynthesis protein [Bariatricus massiliensis]MCQ5252290.1 lipopolysaccharide biosynthesis protein [Bariatricus massiliensis]